MSHYPEPIAIPENVSKARFERIKHLQHAVRWGVSIRLSIVVCEFIGVYFFRSSSLFLDAVSSLLDVFCSLLLLFFIRLAERPPDSNHPFGHGRYEPIAGLQLALLLVVVGGWMFVKQGIFLAVDSNEKELSAFAWIIPFGAVLLLEFCYQFNMKTAKEHNSTALAVEAKHYRIDAISSLFAALALILVVYFPSWGAMIDHLGALMISLFMIYLGYNAVKENLNQLMDRVPEEGYFDSVRKAARQVEGVLGTEKIRIQSYGPDAHVDIDIEVNPHLSVEIAHEISQKVRRSIQKEWPSVRDVTVHIEPFYANDHMNTLKGDSSTGDSKDV